MGGGYKAGRRAPQQAQKRQLQGSKDSAWLLNVCVTALAAGTLIAFGHWFHSTGRRIGGDKRRSFPRQDGVDEAQDEGSKRRKNQTNPKSLAELRLRRLEAAEARLHLTNTEPSATRLTPLGVIFELTQKVDKLEEETTMLLAHVSAGVMSPSEEKTQVQLLEFLALLQLEIDAVQGNESVRPHRKSQTNRIQTLITKLDQVKQSEDLLQPNSSDVESSQTWLA